MSLRAAVDRVVHLTQAVEQEGESAAALADIHETHLSDRAAELERTNELLSDANALLEEMDGSFPAAAPAEQAPATIDSDIIGPIDVELQSVRDARQRNDEIYKKLLLDVNARCAAGFIYLLPTPA